MSMPNAIAKTLQDQIQRGHYASGALLPGQRELAEQLGVSRGALREAISVLATLGFVDIVPGKGTFVCSPHQPIAVSPSQRPTLEQALQMRYIVEPSAAAIAARRISQTDVIHLENLQKCFADALAALDLVAAAECDLEFHRFIATCSGNQLIAQISHAYEGRIAPSQRRPLANTERLREPVEEHIAILQAIAAHDPEQAKLAMRHHLIRAAERSGLSLMIP